MTARRPGRSRWPLQPLSAQSWTRQRPTYAEARPAIIEAAVKRAQARPSGNWYVLGASRAVRPGRPHGVTVAGTELVAWRDSAGKLVVGPGACPHLGAPLSAAAVDCGALVCRWHGLRIGGPAVPAGGAGPAGGRCLLTTTACWPGCAWTRPAGSRRRTRRSSPLVRRCRTACRPWLT